MQCLEARYDRLKEHVPEVKREDVGHIIAAVPCPIQALYGKMKVHANNGIFVAKAGDDVLYAMCSNCSLCGEFDVKKSMASIVEGMEKSGRPWVKYTEETFSKAQGIDSTGGGTWCVEEGGGNTTTTDNTLSTLPATSGRGGDNLPENKRWHANSGGDNNNTHTAPAVIPSYHFIVSRC